MASNYQETAVKTVQVEKQRLAEALRANRDKHRREFEQAWVGYEEARRHAYAELSEASALAASEDSCAARRRARAGWDQLRNLDVPSDHTESYDQAIALMEWEQRELVELSINDFECYVRDRWDWKRAFESNYEHYAK